MKTYIVVLLTFFLSLLIVFVIGSGMFATTARAEESTGLLGQKLAAATKSHDLFTFFHLSPTGNNEVAGKNSVKEFRSTGAFKELVAVYITTDETDTILGMRLVIARSFVDDPKNAIFAADFVKSFLASVGSPTAKGAIADLSKEIYGRAMTSGRNVLIGPNAGVTIPSGSPSAAFQVYKDKSVDKAETVASPERRVQATLQNKTDAAPPALEVTVSVP